MNLSPTPAIPTPPASSLAPSSHASPLPHPRRHPLKPGSTKESDLIRYLDSSLNNIQKRVENRLQEREQRYTGFEQVERDLEGLVDVVWVSGSPNLQTPYLLNLARLTCEYIPSFPFSATPTLRLLEKLDIAFASLLLGRDLDSNEPLPGFGTGRTLSTTDKVRLKSLVNRTRDVVVRHMVHGEEAGDVDGERNGDVIGEAEEGQEGKNGDVEMEDVGGEKGDTVKFEGFEDNDSDEEDDIDEERWTEIQITKVYERTIGELGDVLGGPPIGIITDD